MSAAVAAGVLLLARRIIWCFSRKEEKKHQQKPSEGHTFKGNKKDKCIQAGIFLKSLFCLWDERNLCASIYLVIEPTYTWISELPVISDKIHVCIHLTKTQIKILLPLSETKRTTMKRTQWEKQAYKWRRNKSEVMKIIVTIIHTESIYYIILLFTHFILILEKCML